jgi:hypothetical protein
MLLCKAIRQGNFQIGDSEWDVLPWKDIPAQRLRNYMGKKPDHFPTAEVKIIYDTKSISVMFQVEDRYVRATAAAHQDDVYNDSCVEFFFTPNTDVSKGYFNLEMNCGGTMLFHFQRQPRRERLVIPESDCRAIQVRHSLPRIVNPEIDEPVTWSVAYKIPINLLARYCPVISPTPQAAWRVNFYKCADATTQPHWLTWAPIDLPVPDFHQPQSFGILQFE